MSSEERKKIAKHKIDNIQVYEYYLRAIELIFMSTEDSINKAIKYFQNALEIKENDAFLYSGMAFAYFNLVNIGVKQEDYIVIAEKYANMALSFDPESSIANTVIGYINWVQNKVLESLSHFKKALEVNPNESLDLVGILSVYYLAGKINEAKPFYERLMQIDPLSLPSNWCRGAHFYYGGQYSDALIMCQKFYDIHPEAAYSQFEYSLMLVYNSRIDEGIHIINQNVRMNPDNIQAKLGHILKYSLLGDRKKILNEMTLDFQKTILRDSWNSHHLAGFLSLANLKNEALDWLENSVINGMINYPLLNNLDPFLENIRGEGRFKKLMERVKYKWENFEV